MYRFSLLLAFLCLLPKPAPAQAPNGAPPRPFYIFAHNPNTIAEATNALAHGANALEPDIQRFDAGNFPWYANGTLIVYHDPGPQYTRQPDTLTSYLDKLHQVALDYPQLALVVFDVKTEAVSPQHGQEILHAIRNHLNTNGVNLNVIISVATRDDGSLFDNILSQLGTREGVQVDAEHNPQVIVDYFASRNYSGNIAYGDGTALAAINAAGPLITAIDYAAGIRAAKGVLKTLTYVYALQDAPSMNLYIDSGVDGIIPDTLPPPPVLDPQYITLLSNVVAGRSDVRLATRADNPFQPANQAYVVYVSTDTYRFGDVTGCGTDAKLTFTLTGANGSSSVTVDTSFWQFLGFWSDPENRMEDGDLNYVTIPSRDLGPLQSVTVANDGSGTQPDWRPASFTVYSSRWLGPCASYANNNPGHTWVNDHDSKTFPLTQQGQLPDVTAVPANTGSPIPGYDTIFDYKYWWLLCPGGTVHLASGTYTNGITRLTKPARLALAVGASGTARFVHP